MLKSLVDSKIIPVKEKKTYFKLSNMKFNIKPRLNQLKKIRKQCQVKMLKSRKINWKDDITDTKSNFNNQLIFLTF